MAALKCCFFCKAFEEREICSIHHHVTPLCSVSFEFEYEKLNFLALCGFSQCIQKDKEIMEFFFN